MNMSNPGLHRPLPTVLDETGARLRRLARQHRLDFGWTTAVRGNRLVLEFDDDLWGLRLPRVPAVELMTLMTLMNPHGLHSPVVVLPCGATATVTIFVRPNAEDVTGERAIPAGLTLLRAGEPILLPPSVVLHGRVMWLSSPRSEVAELPTNRLLAELIHRPAGPGGATVRSA